MSETKILRCGIVGAGIGGLGAAIALQRAGHDVEVFERSAFKNEIGAAITLTPNASLILERWGFDAAKAGESNKCQYRSLRWDTLEVDYHDCFDGVQAKYGYMINAFHRVDLHNGLRDLAERHHSVSIRLGCEVYHVDCEAGIIGLTDGTHVQKDLIVVANGDKTRFAKDVVGEDVGLRKTEKSVFRTLIPMDRIMSDEMSRSLFDNETSGFMCSTVSKTGVFFMTYPCRSDELLNCAIVHPRKEDQNGVNDWNAPATVKQAIEVLEGFHPKWRAIISKADFMKAYTFGHQDPLPRITKGKVVLIGDAAHPMMPTYAQGGGTALEDAAALEVLMANLTCNDTVEQRLQTFQDVRLPRCATTQIMSNAMFYSQALDKVDLIRKFYQGPLPPADQHTWSEPLRDFFHAYDVYVECEKAMQHRDKEGRVPEGVLKYFGSL